VALCTQRVECKDHISILDTDSWQAGAKFVADTSDLAGVAWSPDGQSIAAWDTVLTYKLLIYTREGQCLASYSAYPEGLGIRSVCWAPSGQLLSVGSYDQVLTALLGGSRLAVMACCHACCLR
jgi:WD40 repeat protein